MIIGEVALMTRDVRRLADFYKMLLRTDNGSDDGFHQTILAEETMLTVCADDAAGTGGSICLAFTVEDVDAEHRRLTECGVRITEPPENRPWGMRSMCLTDPDGNRIYLRTPIK